MVKVQAGIAALWLVRERRWRDLLVGALVVLGLVLVTLPFVGLNSWSDWLVGLQMRAQSQENLPILYGLSLAQWIPLGIFIGGSVAAVSAALILPALRGLSGLGLASIVASPTLWPHGFLAALPAVLLLDAPILWLGLGIGVGGNALWVLPLLGAWALLRPRAGYISLDALHPLSGRTGPWGTAITPG
jgi:hypothetical protein